MECQVWRLLLPGTPCLQAGSHNTSVGSCCSPLSVFLLSPSIFQVAREDLLVNVDHMPQQMQVSLSKKRFNDHGSGLSVDIGYLVLL